MLQITLEVLSKSVRIRIRWLSPIRRLHITRLVIRSSRSRRRDSCKAMSLEKTRNIGIMAHIDAGKTTTTERNALLYRPYLQIG